jgi:xanthine dehydrogenase small subunit
MHLNGASPTQTLLSYLRQQGFVGTKEGCGDGDCGACTVVMIGPGTDGKPHYQAVNSCLIPVGTLDGRDIFTVEGIANGKLHPVQQVMVESGRFPVRLLHTGVHHEHVRRLLRRQAG